MPAVVLGRASAELHEDGGESPVEARCYEARRCRLGKDRRQGEGARRRLIRWVQRLLMIRAAIDGIGAGNVGMGMIADCDLIIVYLNGKLQVKKRRGPEMVAAAHGGAGQ
ncbi:hypothetical protein M0R45_002015 [Rubus argutus]|uniref:Uncharacterized protein n=1 Tax=Rubus argutus TaxID=59490 RepID=A0AAW1VIQ5_RUBAR